MAKLEIDDFFELEFSKIPKFWKFDKKLFKRFIGILIGLGIIDLIMIIIIPFTQKIKDSGFRLGSGETFKYATYNMGLGIAIGIVTAIILLLILWIAIAYELEKIAYRKASKNYAQYEMEYKAKIIRDHQTLRNEMGIFD